MSKSLKAVLCAVVIIAILSALGFVIYKVLNRYDPDNYIGLTAEQIIDRYGEFDRCSFWDSTGNYRYGTYVVVQEYAGFFERHYEEIFIIRFDENGVAYECEYKDMNKEPGLCSPNNVYLQIGNEVRPVYTFSTDEGYANCIWI